MWSNFNVKLPVSGRGEWSLIRTAEQTYSRIIIILHPSRSACVTHAHYSLSKHSSGEEHDNIPHFPHFFPHHCLIWGLSTVSVTQYQWPCSLMALTGPGLTRRDKLSHVAGDAPLACRLSLHLCGVLWMQPDNGLRRHCDCPFPHVTL